MEIILLSAKIERIKDGVNEETLECTKDGVGEEMKFFTYDIHPRFNILVAQSISSNNNNSKIT